MSQKKEKIGVSLSVETLRLADENLTRLGFSSRSELVDAAINEYISLHTLRQFPDELAEIYRAIEARGIKEMEERMASMLYKVAIEIAQMNLLWRDDMGLTGEQINKLRKEAVKLVNANRGVMTLKKTNDL